MLLLCSAALLVICSHAPWAGSPIVGLRKEDDDDNEDVDSYQEIHFTNNSFPYCEVRGLHGEGAWRGCTRERERLTSLAREGWHIALPVCLHACTVLL